MPAKKTSDQIDVLLLDRPLKRVGNYMGYDTRIAWKCLECNGEWLATPNNVITKNSGCPKCELVAAGKRKSANSYNRVNHILQEAGLELLDPYTRVIDKHHVKCNTCDYVWEVRLNDIVNNHRRCPSCAGVAKLTNVVVDLRLKETNRLVTREGDIINATTKTAWRCNHGHTWTATPDSVLNLKSGCPVCGRVGFASKLYFDRYPHKKFARGRVYLIEGMYDNTRFIKVGITEKTVVRRFAGNIRKYQIKEIASKEMALYDAYNIEQDILHQYIDKLYQPGGGFGGKTECIQYDPAIIEDVIRNYFTPSIS